MSTRIRVPNLKMADIFKMAAIYSRGLDKEMHMSNNAAVVILPCQILQALHRLRCILMHLFTLWPDATQTTRRTFDIDKGVFLRKLSNESEVKKCY